MTDLSTHSRRKPSSSVCSRPGFCLHSLTKARSSLSLRESMVAEQRTTTPNTQPFPYPTAARRRGSSQPDRWPRPPPPKPRPPTQSHAPPPRGGRNFLEAGVAVRWAVRGRVPFQRVVPPFSPAQPYGCRLRPSGPPQAASAGA